jgi:hypothetical protein
MLLASHNVWKGMDSLLLGPNTPICHTTSCHRLLYVYGYSGPQQQCMHACTQHMQASSDNIQTCHMACLLSRQNACLC